METLMLLFGSMMTFVYHCFDRMVINGYLSMLSAPGAGGLFFQERPCAAVPYQRGFIGADQGLHSLD